MAVLIYLASRASDRVIRYAALAVLVLVPFGIIKDWKNPKFADLNFPSHAAEFERTVPGAELAIPINPGWEMKLIKKQK